MSSPTLVQSAASSVVVYLSQAGPVPGLVPGDITAFLRKEGGAFVAFDLAGRLTDLGGGFYEISLVAADTDTLGLTYLRLEGPDFDTALYSYLVVEAVPTAPSSSPSFPVADLFGYVQTPQGLPASGVAVAARILRMPSLQYTGADSAVLTRELVVTKTDSSGFFSLRLLSGADVDIFISATGYRRTLRVPGSNQNLFLIP